MPDITEVLAIVLNDCRAYLKNYYYIGIKAGEVMVLLYCLIFLFRAALCRRFSGKDAFRALIKMPFVALLGFYCYLVLGITILSRRAGDVYVLRLIPFSTWGTEPEYIVLWMENILMMVPMGILLYVLWMPFRKIGRSLLAGCFFSLAIECVQFFTKLGKFEVDDIMNNVFGTLIGFLFCKGIHRLLFIKGKDK